MGLQERKENCREPESAPSKGINLSRDGYSALLLFLITQYPVTPPAENAPSFSELHSAVSMLNLRLFEFYSSAL